MYDTGWFKSTRSDGASEACVEVRITDTSTALRDSKNRAGGQLTLSRSAFGAFLGSITAGR